MPAIEEATTLNFILLYSAINSLISLFYSHTPAMIQTPNFASIHI